MSSMTVDAPASSPSPGHAPVVQVLGLGLRSPALLPDFSAANCIAGSSREEVLDGLAGLTRSGAPVLVLYPSWVAEPMRHWVQVARAAVGTSQAMVYETTLPPTGSGVLATLAHGLSHHVSSPGALLALLPVMERALQDVALLPAVHKLARPNPSVWQHACSVAGARSFAVIYAGKQQRVVTLKRSSRDLGLPELSTDTAVHVATGGVDPMLMYALLEVHYPDARVQLEADVEDVHAFWGGGSWIEAVAHPMNLEALLQLSRQAQPLIQCRWCGEKGPPVERMCQFCGVALSPSSLLGDDV